MLAALEILVTACFCIKFFKSPALFRDLAAQSRDITSYQMADSG
ncbi:hypothetical protein DSM3645_21297 [Blastopirellula marina DSM 3645]|uniref:Uncharacterized protein n=1 Tax=Blastopirellula marina DSM 3645 TaxID=314230 RepID=A3ZR56_9BACT|nr:hypothetical protein DSM3645_21297 [Blastopirellula marina DSM 3645]